MAKRQVLIIATLAKAGLVLAVGGQIAAQSPSAQDVVGRFCELDAQGEQLTPAGRQKLKNMFAAPDTPGYDRLIIIKDFLVSRPFPEGGRVGFRVDYTPVGLIDLSQLNFSALPPTIEMRGDLFVIRESVGDALEWRIEGPMPPPHLTVAAAIRYVKGLRATTTAADVRKRTDKLLAALNHFR